MCMNKTKKLKLPDWICSWKKNRIVYIDSCIADTIQYLWENKIETLSCCCGHGKFYPSVVLSDGYTDKEIINIIGLIEKIDNRKWDVCQWRITRLIKAQNKIVAIPIDRFYKPLPLDKELKIKKAELNEAINIAGEMIKIYNEKGGGYSQKEALNKLIEVAKALAKRIRKGKA